jgi:biofilm PGA synthesis N-glycosyltransferase PgaC
MVALLLVIFWTAVIILVYTYLGYPMLVAVLARLKPRRVTDEEAPELPRVSLIIPAHNEEKVIRNKIENSLALDYPEELFSIVIISDGSADRTDEITNELASRLRIRLIQYQPRRGKPYALNIGVAGSESEIIVFSDANIRYEPDSLRILVKNFSDPSVGCACGKVLLEKAKGSAEPLGEGLYMKYERFIHQNESRFHTMIGTDGAMYAIRRELFKPLPEDTVVDDFVIAMSVLENNYRIVYESKAIGYEEAASSVGQEFKRKVRMIAGGFQAIGILGPVLNPLLHPIIFFQFVSHKLLRWLAPVFMLALLITNPFLLFSHIYQSTLFAQLLFYALAVIAAFKESVRKRALFYFPYYFCSLNLAAAIGLRRFLKGNQPVMWEKVIR